MFYVAFSFLAFVVFGQQSGNLGPDLMPFARTPWPAISVAEIASGHGVYYDVKCMEHNCGREIMSCADESDSLIDLKNYGKRFESRSSCATVLFCLFEEEQAEEKEDAEEDEREGKMQLNEAVHQAISMSRRARSERRADMCVDGIMDVEKNTSDEELTLLRCAVENKCRRVEKTPELQEEAEKKIETDQQLIEEFNKPKVTPAMVQQEEKHASEEVSKFSIKRVEPACLRDHCEPQLNACDDSTECKAIFECLIVNAMQQDEEDAERCTRHVYNLDQTEDSVVSCARTNKCMSEVDVGNGSSFLQLGQTVGTADPSSLFQVSERVEHNKRSRKSKSNQSAAKADSELSTARQRTDALLKEVKQQMNKLSKNLSDSQKAQKEKFALLQKARKAEDRRMEEKQTEFQKLSDKNLAKAKINSSSFLEEKTFELSPKQKQGDKKFQDLVKPLRATAEKARKLSHSLQQRQENLRNVANRAEQGGSFMQIDDLTRQENIMVAEMKAHGEAEAGLAESQKQLKLFKEELQEKAKSFKREVADHKQNALRVQQEDKEKLEKFHKPGFESSFVQKLGNVGSSFLEMSGNAPPPRINAATIQEWRSKFDDAMDKVRSHIHKPRASSFVETMSPTATVSEETRRQEREVARLHDEFDAKLNKLKQQTQNLMAEAHNEVEQGKDLQSKFAAQREQSLLEMGSSKGLELEKERDNIRAMQEKFARVAKEMETPTSLQRHDDINTLLQNHKDKMASFEATVDREQSKVRAEMSQLKKDVAASNSKMTRPSGASFIELKKETDPRKLLRKLDEMLDEEAAKTVTQIDSIHEDEKVHHIPFANKSSFLEEKKNGLLDKVNKDLETLQRELKKPVSRIDE